MSQDYSQHAELLQKVFDEAARILIHNFPLLKEATMELIDLVFCPKVVAKQLALAIAIDSGMMTVNQLSRMVSYLVSHFSSRSRLIRQLLQDQQTAETQDEWMDLAERIDHIQGNDAWRTDPDCPLYERERIAARIDEFVHLMRRRDIFELMFELRGGIGRNKFGLLHEGLFSKAMAGSKVLVETYHNVICSTLDFVCDSPVLPSEDIIPTDARLAFFNEMRHAYGRTALLLSGGAALGFYHAGVVKCLMLNNLMPRVIGGSSAGSIVCAMIATRTDEEVLNDLLYGRGTNAPGHSGQLKLNFFRPMPTNSSSNNGVTSRSALGEVYNNSAGGFHDGKRTWQVFMPNCLRNFTSIVYDLMTGSRRAQDLMMNDTNHFHDCVKTNVGNFTFQEQFDRTGRILNITVTPLNSSDPPRLLNYLTAPHVLVWSAVVASAALPGVFESSRLLVRDADGTERFESAGDQCQKFADGSMEQDLPMQQLSEMFNVNHFIVSQANAHGVMFASYNQQKSVWTNPVTGMIDAMLLYLKNQLRSWLNHFVGFIGTRRITPLFATERIVKTQIFTQEYEGRKCDISLIPWHSHRNLFSAFLHLIYNPTTEDYFDWIKAAERETWKYIPAIKSHIAEEITLDRCVQRLRKRLVAEQMQMERTRSSANNQIMGERVPSFFTSPSLVNFGGLNIADQTSRIELQANQQQPLSSFSSFPEADPVPEITVNSGWGGQGLRGNRSGSNSSFDNIHKWGSNSSSFNGGFMNIHRESSGLFIDDVEWQQHTTTQEPGEDSTAAPGNNTTTRTTSPSPTTTNMFGDETRHFTTTANGGYLKTSSMATFYYRRNSFSSTNSEKLSKSKSESKINPSAFDDEKKEIEL